MKKKIIIIIIVAILIIGFLFIIFRKGDNYKPLEPISELQYIKNTKTFDDVFKFEKIIDLKSKEPSILKGILCLKVHQDKIVILTAGMEQKVIIFDTLGNQLSCIGKKGQGPDEFLSSMYFDIDDNYIYIFDKRQKKILLFKYTGEFTNSFKVKDRYSSMSVKNYKIYLRRELIPNEKYTEDLTDVFDNVGKYQSTITIPIISKTKRSNLLYARNYRIIPDENNVLIASCDDYSFYRYNLLKKEVLCKSNYLPKNIKIIDCDDNIKSLEAANKWQQKNSVFNGIWAFNNKMVLLQIDNSLIFYDNNGNYLIDHGIKGFKIEANNNNLFEMRNITAKKYEKFLTIETYKYSFKDTNSNNIIKQ